MRNAMGMEARICEVEDEDEVRSELQDTVP